MRFGDWLSYWLMGNYVVIGVAYAYEGEYWRVLYWAGAMMIVWATVRM